MQLAIASNPQVVSFNLLDFDHGLTRLIGVDTMSLTGEAVVATLDGLVAGFQQGRLTPPAVQAWPLDQAVQAYATVARGGTAAKQVLLLS